MSQFTNKGENLVADFFRGQGLSALPATNFYIALASAASDSAITELAGTGYARQAIGRNLTAWAGTQGSGTTAVSNGATQSTSNNITVNFGTAGSAWGTANYAVIYDASSSGNALSYHPITAQVISNGSSVSLAPGAMTFTVGSTGVSNYLSNNFIDTWFRGQSFTFPANAYFALFTVSPTNAGGGTEVNGASYARASTPFSLLGFSGTQSSGSTVASSGTGGVITNNFSIAFPAPAESWGTIVGEGVFDSPTAGNLLFWNTLTSRTVLAGSSPQTHAAGSWSITVA